MESITEAVLKYQDCKKGYTDLVSRISLLIYHYPGKYHNLTEEDKSEFYLSFYNRIDGLINNFTYKGLAFETLLKQTLKWHIKTFITNKRKERNIRAIHIHEAELNIKDFLTPDEQENMKNIPEVSIKGSASKRRLLFLVLVDSPNISDEEMERFSKMSGYEYEWLLFLKDTLNRRLFKRNERLSRLREKRNNTYMKLIYKQSQKSEEIDLEKSEILELQICKLKKRLDETRNEISRVPSRPTHAEVAELLKVPKGTVDSGLHYFRKKYKNAVAENSYSLFL